MANARPGTRNRGFASMDEDKQRAIAAKGGRAAHASGNAHEFSSAEARVAGRKGGVAISRNRQHMAAIGREGGHARHANAQQQQQQQQQQQMQAREPDESPSSPVPPPRGQQG